MPESPIFLFDDASPGRERLLLFGAPSETIEALQPQDVPAAFRRIEAALAAGRHLAGWMSYELGYVLEPCLRPLQWLERKLPLLSFGVFGPPQIIARSDLLSRGRAYAGPLRHESGPKRS